VQLFGAGRLKDARNASEGAVAAAEKAYGPSHAEVASRLVNLGLIVRKLGDNRTAASHYTRAVAILEKDGPSDTLGVVLDNLARALQDLGDLDGGLAATTRAIDVLSAALGAESEHVGLALNNLALLQSAKGEHAKAAETCDRAVAILQKVFGASSPALEPFLADQRELRKRASR
jgi:tetratricopeptide (TPR) repeat protein